LFCVAYPRRIVFVCLVVLGSAALLELAQLLTPDRHARLADAIEKIAGGGVGIALGHIMCSLKRFDRWLER
jgi:VanZ family protein